VPRASPSTAHSQLLWRAAPGLPQRRPRPQQPRLSSRPARQRRLRHGRYDRPQAERLTAGLANAQRPAPGPPAAPAPPAPARTGSSPAGGGRTAQACSSSSSSAQQARSPGVPLSCSTRTALVCASSYSASDSSSTTAATASPASARARARSPTLRVACDRHSVLGRLSASLRPRASRPGQPPARRDLWPVSTSTLTPPITCIAMRCRRARAPLRQRHAPAYGASTATRARRRALQAGAAPLGAGASPLPRRRAPGSPAHSPSQPLPAREATALPAAERAAPSSASQASAAPAARSASASSAVRQDGSQACACRSSSLGRGWRRPDAPTSPHTPARARPLHWVALGARGGPGGPAAGPAGQRALTQACKHGCPRTRHPHPTRPGPSRSCLGAVTQPRAPGS